MLQMLVARELRAHLSDGRFLAGCVLAAVIFGFCGSQLTQEFEDVRAVRAEQAGSRTATRWSRGIQHAWIYLHQGYWRQVRPTQTAQLFVEANHFLLRGLERGGAFFEGGALFAQGRGSARMARCQVGTPRTDRPEPTTEDLAPRSSGSRDGPWTN